MVHLQLEIAGQMFNVAVKSDEVMKALIRHTFAKERLLSALNQSQNVITFCNESNNDKSKTLLQGCLVNG